MAQAKHLDEAVSGDRQKGVSLAPLGFEQAVEGLAAVRGPRAELPTLSEAQRDLLLYLGSPDDGGVAPPIRRETLDELVALGLLRVKGEDHVEFTEAGDALYERLSAEAKKKPRGKKKP